MQPAEFDESLLSIAQQRVLALAPRDAPERIADNLARFLSAQAAEKRPRLLGRVLVPPREWMDRLYRPS